MSHLEVRFKNCIHYFFIRDLTSFTKYWSTIKNILNSSICPSFSKCFSSLNLPRYRDLGIGPCALFQSTEVSGGKMFLWEDSGQRTWENRTPNWVWISALNSVTWSSSCRVALRIWWNSTRKFQCQSHSKNPTNLCSPPCWIFFDFYKDHMPQTSSVQMKCSEQLRSNAARRTQSSAGNKAFRIPVLSDPSSAHTASLLRRDGSKRERKEHV